MCLDMATKWIQEWSDSCLMTKLNFSVSMDLKKYDAETKASVNSKSFIHNKKYPRKIK